MKKTNDKQPIAIKVEHVSKDFVLPHERTQSIKSTFTNMLKRKDRSADIQHALKDISFEIKEGEFFGILGRNGSGKSTLLKILAGIYTPNSGSVTTKGKLVPFIELGVGFNPELTGRENVYLNGALLGFSREEVNSMYDDIVRFAELEEFMDQKLKNYSSGMQVRLAFSVATRAEADILLIDEVLAVGDADFQRKCYDYFKSLKKTGKTVVFVTHDMGAVREYCDRGILIQDGLIAHEGDAEEIAAEYLQLFNNEEYATEGDTSQTGRWGNKHISISAINVDVTKKTVTMKVDLQNNGAKVDNVVFGIDIYDSEGQLVGGTESIRLLDTHLSFKEKEVKKLTVNFANIFGGGKYSVAMSVRLSDGVTVFDFWNNAIGFTNKIETNQYFPVVLPATVELSAKKGK